MDKYDREKSLRTFHDTGREPAAQRRAKAERPETASPAVRRTGPVPARRRNLLPNGFPPGTHPDDWEPDDEGDRGPAVSQFPATGRDAPFTWRDEFLNRSQVRE